MSTVIIRAIKATDKPDWVPLWRAYLAFYETELPDEVYDTTFERLLSADPTTPSGFLALVDGKAVGLVHYLYHAHCWKPEGVCYLQDLYADPDIRGKGIGRKLIEAVYAQADSVGVPTVYWTTQNGNAEARKLYDRIASLTDFIKYQR